jgi:hypothetical protein
MHVIDSNHVVYELHLLVNSAIKRQGKRIETKFVQIFPPLSG